LNGRKSSISQGQGGVSNLQSGRPGPRRRETSDSITGNPLATPSYNRTLRDDPPLATPPSSLLRRRTDYKEGNTGSPFEKNRLETGIDTGSPFNSWKRNASGPMSAGITGPSSPWANPGPQSAGFGAFGNFNLENSTATPTTPGEKRLGFGSLRGESRFKGLMSKESSEDINTLSKDKSVLGLEKLNESDAEKSGFIQEPEAFEEDERIGSAALGGDEPTPPPRSLFGQHESKKPIDEIGFSSFGASSTLGGLRGLQDMNINHSVNEPMSPTNTNPFQSPDADKSLETEADDASAAPFSLRHQGSRNLASNFDAAGDRSQNSSAGQQRNLPAFGGLGGLGGAGPWSAAPATFGQSRTAQGFGQSGFGGSLFSTMSDLTTPGGFTTPTSTFPTTRSKMGSLFPSQTGVDISNETNPIDVFNSRGGPNPNYVGADPSLVSNNRGALDDLFTPISNQNLPVSMASVTNPGSISSGIGSYSDLSRDNQIMSSTVMNATATPSGASSIYGRSPEPSSDPNQPPPAQQRQMVMPDRMRWIYRDPSGATQGPFSGLEMHDWYKAGFFSPELQVKKLEDQEYEPLAQLIRRIGNSREPFLVPQIGIPHGQPSGPGVLGTTGGTSGAGAQPPFPNSFPSFGTTLTAEQQNALERRKQEEQYLMARQKEHLAYHQAHMRQIQMSNLPLHQQQQQLHHHSSAHSLQSQPSYGSITSPGGFQHTPNPLSGPQHPGSTSAMFDSPMRSAFGYGFSGENVPFSREPGLVGAMDRLNMGVPSPMQAPFGGMPASQDFGHNQQVNTMLQDRARLQTQQDQWDSINKDDGRDSYERLEQFHQLRNDVNDQVRPPSGPIARPRTQDTEDEPINTEQDAMSQSAGQDSYEETQEFPPGQQTAQNIVPPQPSTSPLHAPAAQRKQYIADVLAAETSSRSQTPLDTPTTGSRAPWAQDNTDGPKGPSLKEIQEAEAKEAKKLAEREEAAANARRNQAEQERIAAAHAAAQATAAGLPSTANWATQSPTSAGTSSPWAKPANGKVTTPTSNAKKSLTQIQKEEEARKNRQAAAAATAASVNVAVANNIPGSKSYANLAGKVAAPINTTGGAWTTVGASGKVKVPSSPAISTPTRAVSGNIATTSTTSKSKPVAPVRSNTGVNVAQSALDEFQKWVRNSLGKGLNTSVNGKQQFICDFSDTDFPS
jgi:PERQ amino acid-rich with GYF domain-containing protein